MKKVIGIILIIVISLVILTGCTSQSSAVTEERFKVILDENSYEIICDTETKVLYLQSIRGYFDKGYGGLTVLVDAEGKPLLYQGE